MHCYLLIWFSFNMLKMPGFTFALFCSLTDHIWKKPSEWHTLYCLFATLVIGHPLNYVVYAKHAEGFTEEFQSSGFWFFSEEETLLMFEQKGTNILVTATCCTCMNTYDTTDHLCQYSINTSLSAVAARETSILWNTVRFPGSCFPHGNTPVRTLIEARWAWIPQQLLPSRKLLLTRYLLFAAVWTGC